MSQVPQASDAPAPDADLQLEQAQQALEELLHAVSHDLGAPLRAMHGFARLLLQDHGASIGDDGRMLLERTVAAGARAGQMVEAIRAHGRLARALPRPEELDLSGLVRAVAQRVVTRHGTPAATLQLAPGLRLVADAGQLQALLEQLLDNACKFGRGEQGARVEVELRLDPAEAVLSVRDHGAGFDMAHAHKLFRLFQRLHRQDEFPGLGAGLATVRLVAQHHGGRAWIEAAPGRGACVFCAFPRPAQPAA